MTGLPPEAYRGSAGPQAATFRGAGTDNEWFAQWLSGNPGGVSGGPIVNEHTALNYLTVYSCVSLIAGTISALPLVTYRKAGAGRVRATDLRAYHVLHDEYNPDTSAPVGRETQTGHLLTWGNSYEQIVRNKSGSQVLALQNLPPDITRPYRTKAGDLRYDVKDRETGQTAADLGADEVVHIPALGFDGVVGYSPVRMAKAAIRAGISVYCQKPLAHDVAECRALALAAQRAGVSSGNTLVCSRNWRRSGAMRSSTSAARKSNIGRSSAGATRDNGPASCEDAETETANKAAAIESDFI